MPRVFYKFVVLGGFCLAALLVFPSTFRHFQPPAALYIHIDSIPWNSITVESLNLSQPTHFDRSAREVRVSPISHGIYRINVRLSDDQVVWSQFFHYDAGVRRRIDLFLAPSERSGYLHFRETANQGEQLFEGETRPADTTAEKPFILDSI